MSWLTAQQRHLGDLYGPVLLILVAVGLVVALLPDTTERTEPADTSEPVGPPWIRPALAGLRPLVLVLVASVAGYTLLFRNGSTIHDYWTFWGVALVAVGAAALADRLLALATGRGLPSTLVTVATVVVVVVIAGLGLARDSDAERTVRNGVDLIAVIEKAPNAADPTEVAIAVYDQPGTLPWADYAVDGSRRPRRRRRGPPGPAARPPGAGRAGRPGVARPPGAGPGVQRPLRPGAGRLPGRPPQQPLRGPRL